jgi:hypothetical protein
MPATGNLITFWLSTSDIRREVSRESRSNVGYFVSATSNERRFSVNKFVSVGRFLIPTASPHGRFIGSGPSRWFLYECTPTRHTL